MDFHQAGGNGFRDMESLAGMMIPEFAVPEGITGSAHRAKEEDMIMS